MIFSHSPSIPRCITCGSRAVRKFRHEVGTRVAYLFVFLGSFYMLVGIFKKPRSLSRHRVRKRQGPSLKTPSLNLTVTSGCQRCIPRSSAVTLKPSSLQKLLPLILLCVFSFFVHFLADFAHHISVSYLSCLSLKSRLKSLLVFNFPP